jgi:hypothetical protein
LSPHQRLLRIWPELFLPRELRAVWQARFTELGPRGSGLMDEQHRRLIKIGLDALAEDFGYALAGGYAVLAHRIVDRLSDDVDSSPRSTARRP